MRLVGLCLGAVWLLLSLPQLAWAGPDLPSPGGRVVDAAHILGSDDVQRLTADLADYESKTSTQIVVVTLPSLQGYPIEEWGLALLRGWQVGQKDKNNGIVLVVAPSEHQIRIETGYGAEGPLPDATASQIIRQDITPLFKQGDFAGGLSAGLRDIEAALAGSFQASTAVPYNIEIDASTCIAILWFGIVVLVVFVAKRQSVQAAGPKGRKGKAGKSRYWSTSNGSSSSYSSSSSSSSGSSSSSSSFSGGGGSGGGGGASGSW